MPRRFFQCRPLMQYSSQSWDKQQLKTDPLSLNFNFEIPNYSLRSHGWYSPRSMLEKTESEINGSSVDGGLVEKSGIANLRFGVQVYASKPEALREKNTWEMLSLDEALTSLERIPQLPSVESFSCILHKCRKKKNLAYTQRLHAYMCKSGLEAHTSLGNYLVPMLVEVGCLHDAQQVFDRLIDRNVYSWTSLMTGYIESGESEHALNLYQKMQEDSIHPSEYTFVALLKACARLKDAERGQELHDEISRRGLLESDPAVGNALVAMYAKCGWLAKAREAFDKLPVHDVVSWTALITGYAKHGFGEEALNCFKQMQLKGVSPNAVTFICILKACGSIGAIDKGQEIHVEIARKGLLGRDLVIGNTLVDMYGKCGLLARAQEVFDKLPVRDIVSWNTLITSYTEHGMGEEALKCFEQMQLEDIPLNVITFVCSLKACGNIGDIDKGREIHVVIARKGLEIDLVVGSTLIDMYAKCNLLSKSQEVFDNLPVRDVVAWNALITGYAKHGLYEEALNCFEQMRIEGVSPNAVTFVCTLKACGNIGDINKGREIHVHISREGLLERDLIVGNSLIDMYGKCGSLEKAQEVFDKLLVYDVVSWNALIAAYAEHRLGVKALNYLEQMQLEGVSPNTATFICSLKACGSLGAVEKGQEMHAEVARYGLERNLVIGSTLVDAYAKCGSLSKAREVFDKLPFRDVISWTALITAYDEHGHGDEALSCFEQMQLEGVSPNAITFVCTLKACGSIGSIVKGRELHAEIARKNLETDLVIGSTLVDMYAKCGSLLKAREVFDKLPVQDVISWNALIAGYAHLGESENVFQMLERMNGEGIKPDGVIFLSVLTVCSHTGLVDKGHKYFEIMSRDYSINPTIEHHTCMVDLLGRAGQLDEAVVMMKDMPFHPDVVVWHSMLGACRKWSNVELGRQAFEHAVRLDENNVAAYIFMSNIYADAHMQEG